MKGARRPPQLPGPVVSRRKRALSEEERELWNSVAKQTRPLRRKRVVKAALPVVEAPAMVEKPVTAKPRRLSTMAAPIKSALPAPAPLASLGRRERSQLSRGKKEIDARLDLHGMTQTRAHSALQAFLHRCHHDGCTFVLVITGKGRTVGPESERGILRRQVPLWLSLPEFRGFVVGYEQASIGHGGEGAIYVRIRRAR
ncbi:DNA mismatch repair protein MutS [Tardiphaga sp. vice352]|uniref:Smr/MutS family protein n=1 Tax=unclassified Tardiphaga TaxID=2631404 RepID=UPI0011650A71|nr:MULTISPECIES: Smr/MutS family protein [unclassified Tardiphaga]QDM14861.1 DNA mismatch repair protein MutS [Tardiphaga sp. vice278]QDM25042.1 DNA mismatch repair protein MutS [Tardiphaga sp. vice304]QDM30252.1 DNA mismatch repair protein MutS [Tardiphaga sp. vice352]